MKLSRSIRVLIVIIILCLAACATNSNLPKNKGEAGQDAVFAKAMDWILKHPASFEDGGFLEMGEEANLFYVLYMRAKSDQEKELYRKNIGRIIQGLRERKNFQIEFAGEITAYLAIAKAGEKSGFEIKDLRKFIEENILNNEMTYPQNITYVILNSALLRDLGYEPKNPMENSIGQGVITTMTKNDYLIPIGKSYASDQDIMNFFYDITHEIFAVSSFGDKNPEQMLMPREIEFIHSILAKGISIYLPQKQLDILCELVICAKIMNYPGMPGFQDTMEFILTTQQEDGSFGLIPRMKDLGRGNLYRHGVLVAVWALGA